MVVCSVSSDSLQGLKAIEVASMVPRREADADKFISEILFVLASLWRNVILSFSASSATIRQRREM